MSYCDIVYDIPRESNKEKLQKVQNSALWCILKCNKCTSVQSMHDKPKILTLAERRELNLASECYKQATIAEGSLYYMFVRPEQMRATQRGNKNKVKIPRVDSEIGRN